MNNCMFLPCFDAYLQTLITNNDIAIMNEVSK